MILVGVGLLVTFSLIALAGVAVYFAASSPSSNVLSQVPPGIADHVYICDHFRLDRGAVVTDPGAGKHYVFTGQCPLSPLAFEDPFVHEMQYRGWTVQLDGAGNFTAYHYARRELLNTNVTDSTDTPNASTVGAELLTNTPPPPEFGPGPSPKPSPTAR